MTFICLHFYLERNVIGCWSMLIVIGHCLWASSSIESSFSFRYLEQMKTQLDKSEPFSINSMHHIGSYPNAMRACTHLNSRRKKGGRWLVVDHKILNYCHRDGKRIVSYYWPVVSFICSILDDTFNTNGDRCYNCWTPCTERKPNEWMNKVSAFLIGSPGTGSWSENKE